MRTTRPFRSSGYAWALLGALLASFGCNHYSEDLLTGPLTEGSAGSSASSGAGNAGETQGDGGTGAPGPTGSSGSISVSGAASSTSGGGDPVGGSAPDPDSAGAGGQGAVDDCPDDPEKVEPGECGCGVPESCLALETGLAHRYSFDDEGSVATDSIGTAHGTIVGVSAGAGKVVFDGSTVAYVDLPNGIVSSLQDATIEVWLEWGGGNVWQRIFDFGTNSVGEGSQGEGTTYLYVTPKDGYTGNVLRSSFATSGVGSETTVRTAATLVSGSMQHLALVVDDTNDQLRLYLNGEAVGITGFTRSLSSLSDVNNWIGRSNFKDAPLKATIEEFRIHKVALTADQVAASFDYGPNPSFL